MPKFINNIRQLNTEGVKKISMNMLIVEKKCQGSQLINIIPEDK